MTWPAMRGFGNPPTSIHEFGGRMLNRQPARFCPNRRDPIRLSIPASLCLKPIRDELGTYRLVKLSVTGGRFYLRAKRCMSHCASGRLPCHKVGGPVPRPNPVYR